MELEDQETSIVIEVKYPENEDLESGCQKALEQIERMGYDEKLRHLKVNLMRQ